MTVNFQSALDFVLQHECVFEKGHDGDLNFVVTEDVPGDAGGLTKYGIDAASHANLDIASLTLAQASAIYQAGEWTSCRCNDLPGRIDAAVFDAAVNLGGAASANLLQRALSANGFAVVIDGAIGPKTIGNAHAAAIACPAKLIETLLDLREWRYRQIASTHPSQEKFLDGWLNRVADLRKFIAAMPAQNTEGAAS